MSSLQKFSKAFNWIWKEKQLLWLYVQTICLLCWRDYCRSWALAGRLTAPSVNQASRQKHILIIMKACEMSNVGSVVVPSCSISAVRLCGLGMWPTPWTVTSLKLCFCGLSLSSLCMSDSLSEWVSFSTWLYSLSRGELNSPKSLLRI